MKTVELSITRIGNSRGIRIPADVLRRCKLGLSVMMEERDGELILRPKKRAKLSWAETFTEMAAEKEDWSEWETTAGDGLA